MAGLARVTGAQVNVWRKLNWFSHVILDNEHSGEQCQKKNTTEADLEVAQTQCGVTIGEPSVEQRKWHWFDLVTQIRT